MNTSAVSSRTDAITPTPASARAALERLVDPATPRRQAQALYEVLALAVEEWTLERTLGHLARPCPRCGTTVHQRVDSITRVGLGPRMRAPV